MGGSLTYDKVQKYKRSNELTISLADKFPTCKGFFPDCPETPDLMASMCRTCPKTDGLKKPKISD